MARAAIALEQAMLELTPRTHISKEEFFKERTLEQIRDELTPYQVRQHTGQDPNGIARIIRNMGFDQRYCITIPIIPAHLRQKSRKPNTVLRQHAYYLTFRNENVNGKKSIHAATPFELLREKFDENGHLPAAYLDLPLAGFRWRWLEEPNHMTVKPIREEETGFARHLWNQQKHPKETNLQYRKRLRQDARIWTGTTEQKTLQLNERVRAHGACLHVAVPSENGSRNHRDTFYHVPVDDDQRYVGRSWRLLRSTGSDKYSQALNCELPPPESKVEYHFQTATHNCQLHLLNERLERIDNNRTARMFSSAFHYHPDFLGDCSKLRNNVTIIDPIQTAERGNEIERKLNAAEQSLLAMNFFKIDGFFACVQMKMCSDKYHLQPYGRIS